MIYSNIYILIPYWMLRPSVRLFICDSVILSVRYRNHFPVIQFQNQAHIRNPRGTGHIFKTIWGAPGTPERGARDARKLGRRWHPNLFFFFFQGEPAEGSFPAGCPFPAPFGIHDDSKYVLGFEIG